MRRSRSLYLRLASIVVMVLATQLGYAGELCRSVMLGNATAGGAQHASGPVGESGRVEMAKSPCCDARIMHASRCVATSTDAATTTPAPSVVSQDSVVSQETVSYVVERIAAPLSRLQSEADPGLSLPPYLVFHRFLS